MIIQRQYVKIIRFCSHFIGIAEKKQNRFGFALLSVRIARCTKEFIKKFSESYRARNF